MAARHAINAVKKKKKRLLTEIGIIAAYSNMDGASRDERKMEEKN